MAATATPQRAHRPASWAWWTPLVRAGQQGTWHDPLWPLTRLVRFAARELHARCTSAVCNGRSMTDAIELADLLTTASRTGAVCVLDLDGVGEVTLNPDQVVQAGSAFKIAVALEVYCQANTGQLDLDEHLRFTAERAAVTDGTIGQAIDLMLRLSDNAASNAVLHRVTRSRIMARLASLGLTHTTVSHDVLAEVAGITRDLTSSPRRSGYLAGTRSLRSSTTGATRTSPTASRRSTWTSRPCRTSRWVRPPRPENWRRSTG
jgi:beta-lactamase class A